MILRLIASATGYYIGLGIEAAIALVAGVLLVLLLANVFVKGEEKPKAPKAKPAAALVTVEGQPDPWIIKDEKSEPDKKPDVMEAVPYVQTQGEADKQQQPIIINVYNTGSQNGEATAEPAKEEPVSEPETPVEEPVEEPEKEKDAGVKFAEQTKTIEELYAELSEEQKKFYDTLKEKALSKPQAKLSVTRGYEAVKVGKSIIMKLQIKKGVTIGEFMIENEALKEYRKSSADAKSRAKLRIRPTVLPITDENILKTGLDMIDLAYEQQFE